MTCHNCKTECRRFGKTRKGQQRYQCCQCFKTYSEPRNEALGGMYTPPEQIESIVKLFVEGCSVRSIERITGVHRDTILRALVIVGQRCERLLERLCQNVPVSDVQLDEMWGYVGCKERRNVTGDPERGDAYCFVAIERNTKLVLTWHLGRRTAEDTMRFVDKLDRAAAGHFQVTTDGWKPYPDAIHTALGVRVSYAQLIKVYGAPLDEEHRYSPPRVLEAIAKPVWGHPDPAKICTSHVERQNLTMRMHIRRLTRLTNAFSKKRENLRAALALHFAWYNLCRVHQTLRVTPAMEAGITTQVWSIERLLTN
ncbi:MAG TPA: IS1 family transposase [Terriglobia bacterium]|nr:IS1 family transposase [Terriglobia bacterium]